MAKIKSDNTVRNCDRYVVTYHCGINLHFPNGFLDSSNGKDCLQCGRPGFDPWVGKIPWRRAWQPTPIFLPGEFHGQRSLAGYSPWVAKGWTRLSN